jgi:hypothetical protein
LEKGNPQSRLGCPSNYGFTVTLETIPGKKKASQVFLILVFQGQKTKQAIRSFGIKFNYSSELQVALNHFISKTRPWMTWFVRMATGI